MTIAKKRKPRHRKKTGKWYADGLRFTCQRCKHCCSGETGFVWVTEREMVRIAQHLGLAINAFTMKYLVRVGSGYSLIELPNGDCVFLQEDGCDIYPVRPLQCATWPFWESNLSSYEAWEECRSGCDGADQGRHYTFSEIERSLLKHKREL